MSAREKESAGRQVEERPASFQAEFSETCATAPARSQALLIAIAGVAAALVIVGVLALKVGHVTRLDATVLQGFALLGERNRIFSLSQTITGSVNSVAFLCIATVLAVVAVDTKRPKVVAGMAGILIGANVSAAVLKSVIPGRNAALFGTSSSFPSGHATAAMSLVLCAVLVAPMRRRRLVAALGAAYALIVGYALLVLSSHYPSDVIGGYLVAALWALFAVKALQTMERRQQAGAQAPALELIPPLAGILVVVILATCVAVAIGPPQPAVATFAASAIGIALIALGLIYMVARLSDSGEPAESRYLNSRQPHEEPVVGRM